MTSTRTTATSGIDSRSWQIAGVMAAFLAVATFHWANDGLWFQGDSPRHAANGLFWWDLLKAVPRDPMLFAVRYYARYPVIAPATYPPLFYLVEGLAFAMFGPSPQVAKSLVTIFTMATGLYTMAWARRWIGPTAGWAGAFLAFVPGIVLWSNAVMLNMPATALGLATLYHFRRWLEAASTSQLAAASCCLLAVLLTYYPGAIIISILCAWGLFGVRHVHFDRRLLWIAALGLLAAVPLSAALLLAPVHTRRQLPTVALLTHASTWTYYWTVLPGIVGRPVLALGTVGIIGGLSTSPWRREAMYVGSWILVLVLSLSLLPARDPRYVLLAAPALTIAAAIGVAWIAERTAYVSSRWHIFVLAAAFAVALLSASRVSVPRVSGFRELAADLRQRAPADAVLYDGAHDGVFGFYARAFDPDFERRIVLSTKLLYELGPTTTFEWVQKSKVASTDDVVNVVRTQCGCRWIAIEIDGRPAWPLGQRLLRQAVGRAEFGLVRSFPIAGAGERRVDLYRVLADVSPVASVDLTFTSLANREFLHVVPITR